MSEANITTQDQELLTMAAKAAGIEIVGLVDKMIAQPDHRTGGFIIRNNRGGDSCWNPLTDDGDALRLAVKLKIDVSVYTSEIFAFATQEKGMSILERVDIKNDPYAATRRAIVRAAAEIGKTL